ncbi:aspartate/glutamate racemase family protein [Aminipila butyrica]|uniref:Aspartate/glutamate racemase family protein n=1 Tax=Aminipila butyrica TaxID=433296 RepID=A0A858BXW3_9FIRM|nr:amino acid racemase [Aminipila butyrica]QIB69750.1 aspartate/glutamate racemase family protein [Aminipila butyrica]
MREKGQKVLGVMGGMGPLATQHFYKKIIEKTAASQDQDHLNMIVLNHVSMPDRTAAIKSGDLEDLYHKLLHDAKFLEVGGADYIAIPSNSCHLLVDRLQKHLKIPIIHMIKEAALSVYCRHGSNFKMGILAADGTLATKLYQEECKALDIKVLEPSAENQERIMNIIYKGIKGGAPINKKEFEKVEREMKEEGCKCVLLASAELSCFKEMYGLSDFYIDAMDVLADRAIVLCEKTLKE